MNRWLLISVSLSQVLLAAEVPSGTHVLLRSEQTVRSNTAKVGDRMHFRTAAPGSDGLRIVLPEGTYVESEVVKAKRSGRVRGKAELEIQATRMIFADGHVRSFPPMRVDASTFVRSSRQQPASRLGSGLARNICCLHRGIRPHAEFVVFGGPGAALATSVVLQRGGEVEVRVGAILAVYFDRAIPLD